MTILLVILFFIFVVWSLKKTKKVESGKEKESKMIDRSGMKEAKYSGKLFTNHNKKEEIFHSSIEDNLSQAINCRNEAKKAVKEARYNDAWGLFSKQKEYYMKHATHQNFTEIQTQALDATVSEELANQLRLEGKNLDALFHIMYWVIGTRHKSIKRHEQKLKAYFNRCKFQNIDYEEVYNYVKSWDENQLLDTVALYNQVKAWGAKDENCE